MALGQPLCWNGFIDGFLNTHELKRMFSDQKTGPDENPTLGLVRGHDRG